MVQHEFSFNLTNFRFDAECFITLSVKYFLSLFTPRFPLTNTLVTLYKAFKYPRIEDLVLKAEEPGNNNHV